MIELDGADRTEPAFIHENACNRIDPVPSDRLEPVVDGRSETVVGVSLEHLRTSPHAINVHRSEDELAEYAACGTIGER